MIKIVVVFDISSDKNRANIAKELFRYGLRTQKSVFEAEVNKNELQKVYDIAYRYSKKDDKVSVYEFSDVKRFGEVEFISANDLIL